MRRELIGLLVDPETRAPLQLEGAGDAGGDVVEGDLRSPQRSYPIVDGIPRFEQTDDAGQLQTAASFDYKWRHDDVYDVPSVHESARAWLVQRYGFDDAEAMRAFMGARPRILDAGCGSGFSASLWLDEDWRGGGSAEWIGLDISGAVDVARRRLAAIPGTSFVQGDVMRPPFEPGSFDVVFSEGVMHHTPSTEGAFDALAPLVAPGGEFMFYVYRRKAPVRELTDDLIRERLSRLDPEQAWEELRPLTRLAQALSDLHAEVTVPEDVPLLEIEAGTYDVQRLVYWHFAKLFWNDAFPFEANVHVNFDWYHPAYAHRHTEQEVRAWCHRHRLRIVHFDAQESGFTVRAVRA
jgi:arsenite methyltransferase